MRVTRALLIAALAAAIAACKGSGPTGPSGGGAGATAPVLMRLEAIGSFTLTFRGQTISTPGMHQFDGVPAGPHEVTGQMTQRLFLSFGTPNKGSGHYDVAVGRTTTVSQGPGSVDMSGCVVTFNDQNPVTGSTEKPFTFRIDVARWESFSQQSPPCAGPS